MRKTEPMKYPHSASLFNFCKEVLLHEKNRKRVIDQDVGHIIGYDAADCSHWKNGKKNGIGIM